MTGRLACSRAMSLQALIIISVFATALLSGILGMAGGMILMAILVSTVSVSAAMMIHGAVQATANASRCWILRRHVQWRILPAYVAGAGLALVGFSLMNLVPDPAVVLVVVGALPWLARLLPRLNALDMNRRGTSCLCGLGVTSTQLLAGASGPLLDMFYLNSTLNRHQIVASKAITQTLGHLLKLVYYGLIVGVVEDIPGWFYLLAMGTAVGGTRVGTRLLDRIADHAFRKVSGWVILAISSYLLIKGLCDIFKLTLPF